MTRAAWYATSDAERQVRERLRRMENIGVELRTTREIRRLTRLEVGTRLGVTAQTVGTWETGVRSLTLIRFLELCALYEVDPLTVLAHSGAFIVTPTHHLSHVREQPSDAVDLLIDPSGL